MVNKDVLEPVIRCYPDGTALLEDRQTRYVYAAVEIITLEDGSMEVYIETGGRGDDPTTEVIDAIIEILKEKFPNIPIRS